MDFSGAKPKEIKKYLSELEAGRFYAVWREFVSAGGIPSGFSSLRRRADEYERVMEMERFDRAYGTLVAGVDEAGRGPLAGPVYAAAVILPAGVVIEGLNDSKKLTEKRRNELYGKITQNALAWHVAAVGCDVIDRVNIRSATFMAMAQAVAGLKLLPEHVLIDGDGVGGIDLPHTCIIKGDSKSQSVAAASILAKVSRDRYMAGLDKEYPQYGFGVHKGYGTAAHYEALRRYGPSPLHRRTFLKNL